MVTARMSVSAQYLARADLRLGSIAARYSPRSARPTSPTPRARSAPTRSWVRDQWSVLAQLAALHGVRPAQVTAEQLDSGGDALLAAFARPEHPTAGRQAALVAGSVARHAVSCRDDRHTTPACTTEPRRRRGHAVGGRARPASTETAQRYLAQIELSLRPSTVRLAEHALRELAAYLTREAPGVSCVADIGRHHIESYKSWLANRPRAGGGTLHRAHDPRTPDDTALLLRARSPNGTIPTRHHAR